MTQEETKIIWIDLSARIMYHPKINVHNTYLNQRYDDVLTCANFTQFSDVKYEVKPYLRLLSNMTEEEKKEYFSFIGGQKPFAIDFSAYPKEYNFVYELDIRNYVKWMNSHHFDYCGLIERELALEAPENMYKS